MSESNGLLLSVLITAYNREKYIAEAIESVLSSSFKDFELIITDDCSTDGTYEAAKKYAEKDSRIRLFRNEKNLGQFANRNYAASLSKGKYIKYLDSDDKIAEDGLKIIMKCMQQFPDAGTGSECKGKKAEELPYMFTPRECYIDHYFKESLLLYIGPSGTVFRKDIFDKAGGFDEHIGILSDTLLMMKVAALAPVVGLPQHLFFWRIHDEQVTVGQQKVMEMIHERYLINKVALESPDCPLSEKEKKIVFRNLKNIFIRNSLRFFMKTYSIKKLSQLARMKNIKAVDVLLAFLPNSKINN